VFFAMLFVAATGRAVAGPPMRQPFGSGPERACREDEVLEYIDLKGFRLNDADRAMISYAKAVLRSQDAASIQTLLRGSGVARVKDTHLWWFWFNTVHLALDYLEHPRCEARRRRAMFHAVDMVESDPHIRMDCSIAMSVLDAADAYVRARLNEKGGYACKP
jgi:hypothetical protein